MNYSKKKKVNLILLFFFLTFILFAQDKITLTGVVLDKNDSPLIGASIKVKNTNVGTVADVNGKFSILAASNAVLVFSYIGNFSQEVTVNV